MSNRRVKAVGYDDDDVYDDYDDDYEGEEEEDQRTDEDRRQLQEGTVRVKSILGSQYAVTDKEIQDSLWHYYYDIDKTVAYLKNSRKPPTQTPKQTKPATSNEPSYPALLELSPAMTQSHSFFDDVPWGNVPACRLAELSHVPILPIGRLLGGSSKPSKLAALAAARKKKVTEDASNAKAATAPDSDRSIDLLDRLGAKKENSKPTLSSQPEKKPLIFPTRSKPPQVAEAPSLKEETNDVAAVMSAPREDLRAPPSIFAQTIFGQRGRLSDGVSLLSGQDLEQHTHKPTDGFHLPYLQDPDYVKRNPFAKPSPDDVVLRVQSVALNVATPKKSTPAASRAPVDTNGVSQDLAALKVSGPLKSRSKNLNVLDEYNKASMKAAASFVVVGHVDHGKSTLMGRLLYDLGVIEEKHLEKLRRDSKKIGKASFALAWVMDATTDERERGVTVDVATNHFETDKTRFTILDAPGHQDFIPNMIAGASQADFAVLVIDASTNSFESGLRGQTKEHALLVRSMGVQRLIVAVNKMDMCGWSEERFEEIKTQMTQFLTTANFSSKNLSFIPCSGLNGENITKRLISSDAAWYTGATLVGELDNSEPNRRSLEKALRMTISEVFRGGINNPVSISGKIDAGTLQVGEVIKIMPSGEEAIIKSLDADNAPSDWAVAGQIVVLNLAEIDPVHIRIGDIACPTKSPIKNVKSFNAKILAFEHIMPMYVDVHRGALHASGRIETLGATLDKTTGDVVRKKPRVVQPGQVARVKITLEDDLPLEAPVKVILRSEGKTVAAGMVE